MHLHNSFQKSDINKKMLCTKNDTPKLWSFGLLTMVSGSVHAKPDLEHVCLSQRNPSNCTATQKLKSNWQSIILNFTLWTPIRVLQSYFNIIIGVPGGPIQERTFSATGGFHYLVLLPDFRAREKKVWAQCDRTDRMFGLKAVPHSLSPRVRIPLSS